MGKQNGEKLSEKILNFSNDDFFNQYEKTMFEDHMHILKDEDGYMKRAIINRAMVDMQSSNAGAYDKLMGYVNSKGIDVIIAMIEKREEIHPIDETEVERIVYRILSERNINSVSIVKDKSVETASAKKQEVPLSERKKPSSKLRKL